jgi:hypothetical protein
MDDGGETELVTIEGPMDIADASPGLPPVLLGRATPAVEAQVRGFYNAVADVFER